jgi:hypothetical protein
MALAQITDLTSRIAAKVLGQYKPLPKFMALLAGITDAAQEVETALWGVVTQLSVDTAQGAWLDLLGKFVGQSREGLADNLYQPMIKARIIANGSNGTIEDLLNTIRAAYQSGLTEGWFLFEWNYVAVSLLVAPGIATFLEDDARFQAVRKVLRAAKSAGVKLTLFFYPEDPGVGQLFIWDDAASPGSVTGQGLGWGDAAHPLTSAGKWCGAVDA